MSGPYINTAVPDAYDYFPLNVPETGSVYPAQNDIPKLFQPLTLKDVTFKNRIFVSPMCQYSSRDGHATDWHLVHIGGFATRGAGAICMEATAVVPEGRISPEDAGLWKHSQMEPLKRIVKFCHAQGTKIGVQLAHAGRKASTYAIWVKPRDGKTNWTAGEDEGGWPNGVYGPSELKWAEGYPQPIAMTEEGIRALEDAFVAAIGRCKEIGFDFIEIHAAHGYLMHSFLSPLSNTRTDSYGGTLENRMRFPLRLIEKCRAAWPSKPLFVRISATDWAEGPEKDESAGEWKQWGIEQSTILVKKMEAIGVDLVDCSSGGNWAQQKITAVPGYQVPFAAHLKKECPNIAIGAVGAITEPQQAESYLSEGKADVVSLARMFIEQPHWPLRAARELKVGVKPANQYDRAWGDVMHFRR